MINLDEATIDDLDVSKAREVLEDLDDFSRMTCGVAPIGQYKFLSEFLMIVEELQIRKGI